MVILDEKSEGAKHVKAQETTDISSGLSAENCSILRRSSSFESIPFALWVRRVEREANRSA